MIRRFIARRRFMREHRWTHAHLPAYADAELGREDSVRVEEHVGMCPHCRRVLATLRRMMENLRGLPADSPAGVADGVIARLREEP